MKHKMVVGMLVVILSIINFSIYSKEQHLKQGQTIYLELAPVDPRSLIQGDYMALRYVVSNALNADLLENQKDNNVQQPVKSDSDNTIGSNGLNDDLSENQEDNDWQTTFNPHDGKIIVSLDAKNIATYQKIDQSQALKDNELTLNYRVRNNKIKFASNAFFFEEGTAAAYQKARYGEFKVNTKGELLLNAMFDEHLKLIKPDQSNL